MLGGAIGAWVAVPRAVLAAALAFGSGALIAAFAFELVQRPFETAGGVLVGSGLLLGVAAFVTVDALLDRWASGGSGTALLAGVTLDGVPENLALGTAVASGSGGLVLLVSIFASNFPESLSGAADMRSDGRSSGGTSAIWLATAAVLVLAVLGGWLLSSVLTPRTLAAFQAFAGGAVVASLADTVMPEAYRQGGPWIAFATVAGFFLSFLLTTI